MLYQPQRSGPYGPVYAVFAHPVQPPLLPGLLGDIEACLNASRLDPAYVRIPLVAIASVLTQAIADVAWPNGQRLSIGASAFMRAPSRSGKSVVFRLLRDPIARALRSWTQEHPGEEPKPALFVEESTRAGLIQQLLEWKAIGLFCDDAGLCKELIKAALPVLAKLMLREPLYHARVKSGRVELVDHIVTVLLMEQPGIDGAGKQLLTGNNSAVGLVNRMFVAETCANQTDADFHSVAFSTKVQGAYEQRVKELVEQGISSVTSGNERPLLRLSPEAAEFLIYCGKEQRYRFRGHEREPVLGAYASSHEQRVLRLAGAVHVFERGPDGEIPLHIVQAADAFGRWSIDHFVRMTDVPRKPSQTEVDAQRLAESLQRYCAATGRWLHELPTIRRQAPNVGLTRARFDRALAALCGQGGASIAVQGAKDVLYVHQQLTLPSWPA